jgi:hypothetical protein
VKGRKMTLGRPRRRWEDNIKMDIEYEGVECIHLAKDKGWGSSSHRNEPSGSIKSG